MAAAAVALCLGVLPIWLATQEFWDGTISSYAIQRGDLTGPRLLFVESNWFISYAIVWLAERLHHLFGVPGWLPIKGWLTLMIVGLAFEAALLGRRWFGLDEVAAWWVAAGVLAFPAWYTYFAYTPMIGHVTGAVLVMLGHRWIHAAGPLRRGVGWPLLVVSFQLNSALAFVIALEACHWLLRDRNARWNYQRSAGVVLLAVGTYLALRLALPPRGLNVGYNSILNPLLLASWKTWLTYSAGFATWLLLLLPAALGWAVLRTRGGEGRASAGSKVQAGLQLLCLGLLVAAASAPYIAVGKGHALFVPGWGPTGSVGVALARSVADGWWFYPLVSLWAARHLLLFTVPFAIASVWLVVVATRHQEHRARFMATALLAAGLTHQLAWALYGHSERLERVAQGHALVQALQRMPPPAAGTVDIELPARVGYAIQLHESNFMMWRAYGATRWATVAYPPLPLARDAVTTERDTMLRQRPETSQAVRLLGVMEQYTGGGCHTTLRVTFPGFSWADKLWRVQFNPEALPRATLDVADRQCRN